jgi:hypothetical protein
MESINQESNTLAGDQFPPSEKPDRNQSVQLTTEATSPARDREGGGPRTVLGKQKSKFNASKHGIFSQVTLLKGEPRGEFGSLLSGFRSHYEPEGTLEGLLVDKLASIVWRHRRLIIAMGKQEETISLGFDKIVGTLDLLLRYESSLERAFDRALSQLERVQRIRKGQPIPPTLNVNLDLP